MYDEFYKANTKNFYSDLMRICEFSIASNMGQCVC